MIEKHYKANIQNPCHYMKGWQKIQKVTES